MQRVSGYLCRVHPRRGAAYGGVSLAIAISLPTLLYFGDEAKPPQTTAQKVAASTHARISKLNLLRKRIQSSPELAHFLKFASVELDGEQYMSPNDFFASIGIENPENAPAIFQEYFTLADTDHNELLSYSEYSFFVKLLSTGQAEFKLAFQLFDTSGDGLVSKDEFEAVMKTHTSDEFDLQRYSGLEERFFGKEGKKQLKYEEFVEFLAEMKMDVLAAAFKHHDTQQKGTISMDDFVSIVSKSAGSAKATALAKFFKQHFRKPSHDAKQPPADEPCECISLDEYMTFQALARDMPAVERVLELHTATGGRIDRGKFERVLKLQTQGCSSAKEVDLIFQLFDHSGEGYLDQESFMMVLEATDERATLKKMTLVQSLALGGLSAMIGACVVFPIDKCKTLMQSSIGSTEGPVKAMGTQFRTIIQREGVRGLYRGLLPQLVGITPEKALKLTVNDRLRKLLRGDEDRDLLLWEEIAAGMGTGVFQVFVTNPYELLKIRIQIQAATGDKKPLPQVIRETGLRGMYTGLPATLLRDIPFNMLYFSTYAALKKAFRDENGNVSSVGVFAAGAGAGMVAAALDTPADTIKTRLQNGSGRYKNVRHAFRTIVKEEGFGALMRGVLPRVIIIAPMFSITFAMFEFFQRVFLPNTEPPADILGDVAEAVRKDRLTKTAHALETNYGIRL